MLLVYILFYSCCLFVIVYFIEILFHPHMAFFNLTKQVLPDHKYVDSKRYVFPLEQ